MSVDLTRFLRIIYKPVASRNSQVEGPKIEINDFKKGVTAIYSGPEGRSRIETAIVFQKQQLQPKLYQDFFIPLRDLSEKIGTLRTYLNIIALTTATSLATAYITGTTIRDWITHLGHEVYVITHLVIQSDIDLNRLNSQSIDVEEEWKARNRYARELLRISDLRLLYTNLRFQRVKGVTVQDTKNGAWDQHFINVIRLFEGWSNSNIEGLNPTDFRGMTFTPSIVVSGNTPDDVVSTFEKGVPSLFDDVFIDREAILKTSRQGVFICLVKTERDKDTIIGALNRQLKVERCSVGVDSAKSKIFHALYLHPLKIEDYKNKINKYLNKAKETYESDTLDTQENEDLT